MIERAQRNPFGFVTVLAVPADYRSKFEPVHLEGLTAQHERNQFWTLSQAGVTFMYQPSEVIFLDQPEAELQGNEIWYKTRQHLDENVYYDAAGERLQVCNWKRIIVLATLMTPHWSVWNMWGRSAIKCAPDPANPLDPWGPSMAGGPTGKVVDILAGLRPTTDHHPDPRYVIPVSDACTIHESWHCWGCPHMDDKIDGPDAWLDPMGYQFNFWRGKLVPRTINLILHGPARHFFS